MMFNINILLSDISFCCLLSLADRHGILRVVMISMRNLLNYGLTVTGQKTLKLYDGTDTVFDSVTNDNFWKGF